MFSMKNALSYLNKYLDYCQYERGLSMRKTVPGYRDSLKRFFVWLKNDDFNKDAVTRYMKALQTGEAVKNKWSSNSTKYEIIRIKTFVKWLHEVERVLDENFTIGLKLPRTKETDLYLVSKERMIELLKLVTTPGKHDNSRHRYSKNEHYWACMFSLATGLRNVEVRQLKIENINLSKREANVPEAKGGNPKTVAIPSWPYMIKEIEKRIKNRKKDDKLFDVNEQRLQITMRRCKKIEGVPANKRFVFHSLRNIFANDLFDSGADIERVKVAMCHRNIQTTEGYLRHSENLKHNILDQFESVTQKYKTNDEKIKNVLEDVARKSVVLESKTEGNLCYLTFRV